jgi:hypothetical protein
MCIISKDLLLDGEWETITRKVIEKAKEGDAAAQRLCFDRLFPARRSRPVEFDLPVIETAADALGASSAVLAACADGILSPAEAQEVLALIATHVRLIETSTLEARLSEPWAGRSDCRSAQARTAVHGVSQPRPCSVSKRSRLVSSHILHFLN